MSNRKGRGVRPPIAQVQTPDELLGTGAHAHKTTPPKRITPKKQPVVSEETTTTHINKEYSRQIDMLYRLAGYSSKVKFINEALEMALDKVKKDLERKGIDLDALLAM